MNECKYNKRRSIAYRKENPDACKEILEEYAPVFDQWVAIAMFLKNVPPPRCEICGERTIVAKRQPSRHQKCAYNGLKHTYDSFVEEYKGTSVPHKWIGALSSKDRITLTCSSHGEYTQVLNSALAGHSCRECYVSSREGRYKYTPTEWMETFRSAHGDRYEYVGMPSKISIGTKIRIICKEHGEFEQQASLHKAGHGCALCAINKIAELRRFTKHEYVALANKIHNEKYDYSKVNYINSTTQVTIICPEHGEFTKVASRHTTAGGEGCPTCACNHTSKFEESVAEFIKSLDIPYERTNRSILPGLHQLDIFIQSHGLAIECNGDYYHSERDKGNASGRGKEYHLNKTKLCEEQGIQLIHIWEHDWIKNPELIKRRLLSKLGKNEKVFARKTQVAKLTTQTAAEFLNQHHIQGTCPASVKFGLLHDEEVVAVMSLGKSRFSKNYEWELLRYCSTKQVIGGASKLFKHFQREYQPKSVVSYSDKMWNTGNVYKQLGFEYSHTSAPSYYYTKNYYDYENRVAYQKHKLHKKLEHFDPNLTEWENMQANGFDRIWDCGSDVWVWESS